MADFHFAFRYSLKNEGGFSDHPLDHGGPTNFGITQVTLSRWLKRPVTKAEVKNITEAVAREIYKAWYWDSLDLGMVRHNGIAAALFDIGIVRGIGSIPKMAQTCCNQFGYELVVDGHIGPKTLGALNSVPPPAFILAFAKEAEAGFNRIVDKNPSQKAFLKGWIARARRLGSLA